MTSKNLSARHAYNSNEVRMNEQFVPLHLEMRGKKLGMDFRVFDSTVIASEEVRQRQLERALYVALLVAWCTPLQIPCTLCIDGIQAALPPCQTTTVEAYDSG